jgi:hypothetical protein
LTPVAHVSSNSEPISFDIADFERLDENSWFDPHTPDVIVLGMRDRLPRSPVWLEDIGTLRRALARMHAATGTLLEADAVSLGGTAALYTLVAEHIPEARTGRLFRASFVLAKADRTAVLTGQFQEWDITGVRETTVRVKLGTLTAGRGPHPYDPRLPYEPSDDAAWDSQFPQHPLTKARSWTRRVCQSAVVDETFAALPEFRAG